MQSCDTYKGKKLVISDTCDNKKTWKWHLQTLRKLKETHARMRITWKHHLLKWTQAKNQERERNTFERKGEQERQFGKLIEIEVQLQLKWKRDCQWKVHTDYQHKMQCNVLMECIVTINSDCTSTITEHCARFISNDCVSLTLKNYVRPI